MTLAIGPLKRIDPFSFELWDVLYSGDEYFSRFIYLGVWTPIVFVYALERREG